MAEPGFGMGEEEGLRMGRQGGVPGGDEEMKTSFNLGQLPACAG